MDSISTKTAAELARPEAELLDEALGFVANGGTVFGYAKLKAIKAPSLHNFLCATPERRQRYFAAMKTREEFDRERVLARARQLALVDVRELYDERGNVRPPSEWSDDLAAAVQGLAVSEDFGEVDADEDPDGTPRRVGRTSKVKLVNPLAALELFGRELGMFKAKVEVSGKVTLEMLVTESLADPPPPTPASGLARGGESRPQIIDEISEISGKDSVGDSGKNSEKIL